MGGEESVYANIDFTTLVSLSALAVSDITDMSATLSWEAPQTSNTLTGYAYQYKKNSDANWSDEVTIGSTTTSVTLSGLTSGTNYQFRAKPLYSDHVVSYTTIGFTTLAMPLPNLAVSEVTNVSATLTWDAPETSYTIISYAYQYKKSSDANWPNEVITTNTTVFLDGLSGLTEYQFRAKVIFSDHESNYTTISFTTITSLPYEYGFENGMAGWSTAGINWGHTGITSEESHTGDNSFFFDQFAIGEHNPQYLISPPFVGTDTLTVSFYHYTNSTFLSSFQIGYSTTTDAPTAFTWVDTITTSWHTWNRYEHTFPEGTRYVAFSYDYVTMDAGYPAYLDDFSFEAYSPYAKPTDLAVSNLTDQSATLSWTVPDASVTGYAYQYKILSDGTWSALTTINTPSVTLNGLTANTFYNFRVKALYAGGHASNYESTLFQAEGGIEPLPHYQDFENGMGSWRIVNGGLDTEIDNHTFCFDAGNSTQYLMSPQFDGSSALATTFSYRNLSEGDVSYIAFFQVGYSTTTKDTDAFIWGDTIISSHQWQQYTDEFPVGTKYVAVKRLYGYWLRLDNFIIEALCPAPSELIVDINNTEATVSWSSDADAWQLCLNNGNYIEVSEPTYTFTGLVPPNNYTVKVRNHCNGSSSGWGEWSPLLNFTVPIYTFPWTEDFNELTENGSIPYGWDNQEGTASPWCYTSNTNSYGHGASNNTGHNGSKCVRFDSFNSWSGRSNFLKTVRLALPAEPAMKLSFWYRNPVGGDFSVYISTDGGVTHETALATGLTSKNSWTRINPIDLSAYAGQEVVIVFKGTSNTQNDDAYIYLDDVRVMPPIQVLTLADNADNSGAISEVDGHLCDVVVDGRTLYRDGSWNTICLPFDLNDFRGTSLEGAIVKTLASSTYSDDVLTMNFTDALTAIEAGKPYIAKWNPNPAPNLVIHSASEWDAFVNDVNMHRKLYRGKVVKLAADISVTTMVGTETCPFCGTFDGDGHTLTVNLNSTEQYLAPFRYVDGVTICNLTVAGDITTSAKFAGGVVAHMTGTSSITHCISNVTINSSVNGDGTHGGFIAVVQKGATTITDCVFNGKFLGPNTTHCGGFVGWTESNNGATLAITNCLFAPTQITISETSGNTFSRARYMGSVTITNSYYTQAFGGAQGIYTTATGTTLQTLLGDGWELSGDAVVPKIGSVYENIVNLTFPDVTVSNATANVTTTYADFIGSHAPLSGNGLLLDAHNHNGHAQHAALDVGNFTNPGYSFAGCYIDAEMTIPATAIPFADDGTVTLYVEGPILTFDNDTDNTGIISENDGQQRNVVFTDRTIYKDGNWNTLCLPFNLDDLSGTPLEGATVKTLASSTYSDDVLTMNFTDTLSAIEAGKPYIVKWDPSADADLVIRTSDDWDAFAYNVSHAIDYYQGKIVKLAADITVTTMVGTTATEFKGTFDGCGHTLTVDYTAASEYCAPFCCIFAATIKNLRVAGTIHTDYKYAAGLVAKVYGAGYALRIQNCRSSVDIISSTVGDGAHGGFVALENTSGIIYFNDCVFDGSVTGSQTEKCGGFIGWRDGYGILRLTNCLMAGTMDIVLDDNSAVFCRNGAASTVLMTNCYYKGEFGSATPQGTYTDATGTALQALLGDGWTVRNGEVVPKADYNHIENPMFTDVTISSATANITTDYADFIGSYAPFSSNGLLFDAHNLDGDAQHAAFGIGEIDTPTGYILASWHTDAELTTPATAIPFADDGTVTLYAKSWPGEGDECTINNTWEWDLFCDALQDNDTYNHFIGKTVKLSADISVTRMAGSSGHEFGGTFDGQGHTLTVNYQNNNGTVRTAPFSYINGATIQNLIVAGNITGTASRAAGIVGETGSILSHVTNCVSSVNVSGGSYTGGISVGGKVEITGCVFNGTITGTSMSGGFVGWSTSSLVISGCLFAPQEGSSIVGGTFYYNGGGEITPINSYYTMPLGTPQGIQAITNEMARPAGEAINIYDVSGITTYVNGMQYGDIFYYDPDKNFSVEGDVYTIYTATGWDFFCEALQDNDTYNRFIDKTVKLGADISVTRMAGGSYHDFMGTFDGQGHTLTVSYGSASSPIADDKAAPFVNVEVGCIIKNLHVAGDIYTSAKYAGGLVGTQYCAVGIENCHISTIIHSSTEGDGTHGGIVGLNGGGSSSSLTITGCLFDGKLLTTGTTTNCGGFVGWRSGTCTIVNSLYAPAAIAEGESEITNGSATFVRNGATALTNSYYTRTLGTEQGFPAISNPAITPVGEPTGTYPLSSLTAYVNGLMYGDVFYYNPERNFLQTIAGYSTGSGGWNLLASPVADTVTPTEGNGFLINAYDLYRFNPTNEGNEWENYKAASFSLENGRGYLYANSGDVTLNFAGVPIAGNTNEITLAYDADDIQKCWNLVGNPFPIEAYLDREYYVLSEDGLGINPVAVPATTPVPPFTAVFVKAVSVGDAAVFTKVTQ